MLEFTQVNPRFKKFVAKTDTFKFVIVLHFGLWRLFIYHGSTKFADDLEIFNSYEDAVNFAQEALYGSQSDEQGGSGTGRG